MRAGPALLEQLATETAHAVTAAERGDADAALEAIAARAETLSELSAWMQGAGPEERESAAPVLRRIIDHDRALGDRLAALRDETRQAIEQVRAARTAASNANPSEATVRFVSERA